MTSPVYILKIGPLPDMPAEARFLYVPVAEATGPDQMITAADDTSGFRDCRLAMPDTEFICDPAMSPDQPDAKIADRLPENLLQTRADLALAVSGDAGRLPDGTPSQYRRLLLRYIGPFLIHHARIALTSGGAIESTVAIERPKGRQTYSTQLRAVKGPDDAIAFEFGWGGGTIAILLDPPGGGPAMLETAFLDAYGLETVPRAETRNVQPNTAAWADFYLVAGLTFATAIGLDLGQDRADHDFPFASGGTAHVRIMLRTAV